MNKQTKILIAIAVVGGLGYFLYQMYRKREFRFADNTWSGTHFDYPPNSVAFLVNGSHSFRPGDVVIINQDSGYTYASYNGQAEVVKVKDNVVVIDKMWAGSTPVNPGTIRLA